MSESAPIDRIIWLAVQPTPYNRFLFASLRAELKESLTIFYSQQAIAALPWKSGARADNERFLRPLLGVDWRLVWQALSEPETMFIVAGWDNPTKLLSMVVRRLFGYPYAIWTDTIKTPGASLRDWLKRTLLRWLTGRRCVVLTTGDVGVSAFRASGYAYAKVPILSLPFFVPLPSQRKDREEPAPRLRFLCCGRLVPRKGMDFAIRAAANCLAGGRQDFELVIAGVGPEESELRRLVNVMGADAHVKFAGWLESEQLQELRSQCDVFIHAVPAADPFPVAVLEAMASGLAIISTRFAGSASERVIDGVSGIFVAPTDVEALAEAMRSFIDSPALARRMGSAARVTAEQWPPARAVGIIQQTLEHAQRWL